MSPTAKVDPKSITTKTPAPAMVNTPGYKTSEFWLTVLGVVALVILTLADRVKGDWAAPAIAFACFGYGISRAIVKAS